MFCFFTLAKPTPIPKKKKEESSDDEEEDEEEEKPQKSLKRKLDESNEEFPQKVCP